MGECGGTGKQTPHDNAGFAALCAAHAAGRGGGADAAARDDGCSVSGDSAEGIREDRAQLSQGACNSAQYFCLWHAAGVVRFQSGGPY